MTKLKCLKIWFLDLYIIKGKDLRKRDSRLEIIEREYTKLLDENELKAKIRAKETVFLLNQISILTTQKPHPLCPKCGKPKTACG